MPISPIILNLEASWLQSCQNTSHFFVNQYNEVCKKMVITPIIQMAKLEDINIIVVFTELFNCDADEITSSEFKTFPL